MKNQAIKVLASGLGTGYFPVASGTWGTLLAALLFAAFPTDAGTAAVVTALAVILSVPVSGAAERLYGRKDDSHIVIDEIVGFWLSMLYLPRTMAVYLAAFFLFRLYDVTKPLFVRRAQDLPGGLGIVADDVLAGVLTNLTVRLLLVFFGG